MSIETIEDGVVAAISYVLKNDAGEELDRSADGEPMHYLHGASNIVPGLERALAGKKVGDEVDAVVAPKDGYGEATGGKKIRVPVRELPEGFQPVKGASLMMRGENDHGFPVFVLKKQGPQVVFTTEHPLAGVTLHFAVKVESLRAATDEEKSHGHAHGPGGHDHGHDGDADADASGDDASCECC